jgi:dipeptidase E
MMKLLLTSGGLRNKSLNEAFLDLAGVPASKIKVAFIPTAGNVETGDKSWIIAHMTRLQQLGIGQLDIVDISALPKDVWLPRLQEANVIFVNGGNTKYLMKWIAKSGLQEELPKLLEDRLYVGVSAGSYVAAPDIRLSSNSIQETLNGLGYIDFWIQAHYKNPAFPLQSTLEAVKERIESKGLPRPVYVLDDESAVKVVNGKIDVVSEGEHFVLT